MLIQRGGEYMKHLKIDDKKGYFTRGESWIIITDMTKNDLLNLAHAAIEDADFEMDVVSSNFASADFRKIKTYNFQKS